MSETGGLFGQLLVEMGLVTPRQLVDATRFQNNPDETRKLGELLIDLGWVTRAQLTEALEEQKRRAAARQDEIASAVDPAETAGVPEKVSASSFESLNQILELAVRCGASDVHLHSNSPLRFRIHGRLSAVSSDPISPEQVRSVTADLLDENYKRLLEEEGQVDFSREVEGLARLRINAYRQQSGPDLVLRLIPPEVLSLDDLGLPRELARFTTYHQGLVLITGPSGCGKTSTLASLVNIINQERSDHIITAEDPIEYIHHSENCVVNQRQVGTHSQDFPTILRAALREDPDVIVLGELRDLETVSLALTAAETGHLVLGTLHTGGAIRTINRLIGLFPPDEQPQVRVMLSESLRAVISQRLAPRADGQGRVPALELMIVTRAIGNLIREKKVFQIETQMQTGKEKGMRTLKDSFEDLVRQGIVTSEEAQRHL